MRRQGLHYGSAAHDHAACESFFRGGSLQRTDKTGGVSLDQSRKAAFIDVL